MSFSLPVKHVFDDAEDDVSWRIAIEDDGELVLRFVDGRDEIFAVRPSDTIVAVDQHLYASFAVRPGTPPAALERAEGQVDEPVQPQQSA